MNSNRLLIVDDEADVAEYMAEVGRQMNFDVGTATTRDEFVQACKTLKPTMIILDLQMPGTDGVEVLRLLTSQERRPGVLLVSGMGSKVRSSVMRLGESLGLTMLGELQKPVRLAELEAALARVIASSAAVTPEALGEAIRAQQFVLYYQPKISLSPSSLHRVLGVEGLLRWIHPERGVIPPAEFLPVAESCGLMDTLTHLALSQGIEQAAAWQDAGLQLQVAINISPSVLFDLSLPDQLTQRMQVAGLESGRLILEITESAAMTDAPRVMDILARLRIHNIGVSMDDLGTGYSSLMQLYRMPFNELKIDRSFVADLDRSKEAEVIIKATIGMAAALGISSCAEGVETESALNKLSAMGCDTCQGFFIARPMPAAEIHGWIVKWDELHGFHNSRVASGA